MNKIFLFYLLILLLNPSYSQTDSTIFFIRNGQTIPMVVSDFQYGRIFSNHEGKNILINVVDSLWTPNENLALTIGKLDSSVIVKSNNKGFFISFASYDIPFLVTKRQSLIKLRKYSVLYYFIPYNRLGLNLNLGLRSLQNFFIQVGGSIGINRKPPNGININVGAGHYSTYNRLLFKQIIGYGYFAQKKVHSKDNSGYLIFFSPEVDYKLIQKLKLSIIMGLCFPMYQSEKIISIGEIDIYFGFGFEI